jgi:hypothetical protein
LAALTGLPSATSVASFYSQASSNS